jgi:chemotaxis protein CheC
VSRDVDLTALERDALQEAGNIGAGHAATALSDLLGRPIMNRITHSKLCSISDAPAALGSEEEVICGVIMGLESGVRGAMMMLFPFQDSARLFALLSRRSVASTDSPEFRDAMEEVGNICICSYLNALADLFDLRLFPTPPNVAVDMLASILDGPLAHIHGAQDQVIIIETQFVEGEDVLRGFFLFLPDVPSLDMVLRRMGVR